jgi:phosphinothricin acetyltransferase
VAEAVVEHGYGHGPTISESPEYAAASTGGATSSNGPFACSRPRNLGDPSEPQNALVAIVSDLVRPATGEDLPALADIYNHYVRTSHATFDLDPAADGERWLPLVEAPSGPHRLFVSTVGDRVTGFASSAPYRPRAAYRTTVETSAYVAPDAVGRGVGSSLYAALIGTLEGEDVHRAVAGIAQPNRGSVALHLRFGFVRVAHFSEQGRKFDRWWDVDWYERRMDPPSAPAP